MERRSAGWAQTVAFVRDAVSASGTPVYRYTDRTGSPVCCRGTGRPVLSRSDRHALGEVRRLAVGGSGSPRYSGASGSVLSTVQSHTVASWSPMRDTRRRELWVDPACQVVLGEDGAVRHRLADELGRGHRGRFEGDAVGQRCKTGLQGVEHSPDAPHARWVVLGDVAVEQEVAGCLLHAACAAFDLGVEALARTGVDRVDTVGVRRPRPASCTGRCWRSSWSGRPPGWRATGRHHRAGGRCGTARRRRARHGTWSGRRGSPAG